MTLNLTIVNPFGIWQGSDHRLTDPNTGVVVEDFSVNHVILRCRDGSALLAYAGAGRIEKVDLSDWLRETLRGENRILDESLIFIRENATKDLGALLSKRGIPHMFSVGAFLAGRPWCIQIRNFNPRAGLPEGPILDHFVTVAKQVDPSGRSFIFGGTAVSDKDRCTLFGVASRKPRRPKEFRNLLAAIIRRSAATEAGRRSISPHCVTSYVPPTGEPFESEFHDAKGANSALTIPMLLFGIDTTEMQRNVMTALHASWVDCQQSVLGGGRQKFRGIKKPFAALKRPAYPT